MGVPVVAVVRDMPEAFYLVLTIMIFLLCMAVLLLIYLPKMFLQHKYAKMTVSEQRRALQACLNRSSVTKSVQEGEASLSVRNFALNSNSERNSEYSVPPKPFLETIASGVEELAIQEENSLSRDSTEAPTKIATEIKLKTSYQDQKAMR